MKRYVLAALLILGTVTTACTRVGPGYVPQGEWLVTELW